MTLFKNLLSFCFTFFFCNTFVWGQCPQGDVILETQLEVDNFAADYPFCTEITETLNIGVLWNDSDIIDLSNLPPIESIGNLDIRRNPALTALSGLENLTSISGYLRINDNDALTDLSGLENLTSISGYLSIAKNDALTDLSTFENLTSISRLTISDNDGLTDLSGFENLTSIGGDLWITYNDGLTDLSGLENLISIDNELRIYENANLTDLSRLENLDSIGGNLDIEYNGALTTLNAFENLTSIGGELSIRYNDALTDLNAFENLTSISDDLGIWDNDILTDLSAFENLTSIGGDLRIIESDGLTDLSGLENLTSIGNLVIHRNDALTDLSALENLTSIDGKLSILINNALTDLSGFENLTSIGELTIQGNDALTDLSGLENLTSIGEGLIIWGNNALTDLSGFENLTSIDGNLSIIINNVLTDLSAFENLTSIGGNLRIESNGGLTDLSALGNLTSFDGELSIYDNSALSICEVPFICAYLYDGGISSIYDNAPGCSSVVEILNACSFIPKVYADVFYDLNQNGTKEANELNYYDVSISIMPGGIFYLQNTGIIFIESGTYTATFDTINNPNWQLTTMPSSYTFSLDEGETDTITFGIYPSQEISHIQTIINSPPVRCNETIIFDVTTKNIGTIIANGTTWFTIDDVVPAFNFIDEPDTVIVDLDTYGWYFTDLYPGQSITKKIEITVPGPPDFEIGEQLLFVSFSEFMDANGEDGSEAFRYNPEVLCSYDPNDKLVNPNREGDYALFDEDLIYTIRFQNTGNDVAYDVVIRDTLDVNLDLSTFRVLGSSHANRLNTILNEDEGILTFEFRDIFLPDSTSNFEASQGYVSYLIHTIDGLAEDTPVTNSAGIYFDLNPPVITNTTQSIMVSELPTVSTEVPDNSFNFNISPNPNTGTFIIQGIPKSTYQILNTSGQIIQQGDMQNDLLIDISRETQGVYFISLTIDNETFVRRIVKM